MSPDDSTVMQLVAALSALLKATARPASRYGGPEGETVTPNLVKLARIEFGNAERHQLFRQAFDSEEFAQQLTEAVEEPGIYVLNGQLNVQLGQLIESRRSVHARDTALVSLRWCTQREIEVLLGAHMVGNRLPVAERTQPSPIFREPSAPPVQTVGTQAAPWLRKSILSLEIAGQIHVIYDGDVVGSRRGTEHGVRAILPAYSTISRVHARFRSSDGGRVEIVDEGALNGTLVRLASGEQVHVHKTGRTAYCFAPGQADLGFPGDSGGVQWFRTLPPGIVGFDDGGERP